MRDGDADFLAVIKRVKRAIRQMNHCFLNHSAKDVDKLLQYTIALDKNQKALIQTILKLQRENRILSKAVYSNHPWEVMKNDSE